ncbi:unnamed protein product, partial [Ilex paraguariensis]
NLSVGHTSHTQSFCAPLTAMASKSKLHVVMFPWLAFGHMISFLDLFKFIAQKGHKVSFISTPRNIKRLPNFLKLSLRGGSR